MSKKTFVFRNRSDRMHLCSLNRAHEVLPSRLSLGQGGRFTTDAEVDYARLYAIAQARLDAHFAAEQKALESVYSSAASITGQPELGAVSMPWRQDVDDSRGGPLVANFMRGKPQPAAPTGLLRHSAGSTMKTPKRVPCAVATFRMVGATPR
mgnify:CR=1 FL=1